jgi:hypothetical protein
MIAAFNNERKNHHTKNHTGTHEDTAITLRNWVLISAAVLPAVRATSHSKSICAVSRGAVQAKRQHDRDWFEKDVIVGPITEASAAETESIPAMISLRSACGVTMAPRGEDAFAESSRFDTEAKVQNTNLVRKGQLLDDLEPPWSQHRLINLFQRAIGASNDKDPCSLSASE